MGVAYGLAATVLYARPAFASGKSLWLLSREPSGRFCQLGLILVLGLFTRAAALGGGLLPLSFAFTMTLALGVKSPLNFSVFSASAASFLLAAYEQYPLSLDALLRRDRGHQRP